MPATAPLATGSAASSSEPTQITDAASLSTRTTVMPYLVTSPGSGRPAMAYPAPPVSAISPIATTAASSTPTASRGSTLARRCVGTSDFVADTPLRVCPAPVRPV